MQNLHVSCVSSLLVSDRVVPTSTGNVSVRAEAQRKHVLKRTQGHRSAATALRDGLIAAARPRDRGRRQANARHALARRDELTPYAPGPLWGGVRTGHAYQPTAFCTYRRHGAACPCAVRTGCACQPRAYRGTAGAPR